MLVGEWDGAVVGRLLRTPRVRRTLDRLTGAVLIDLGVRSAVT
ncbi:hypothetical protein GA0070607_6512 [Micromonospora coriariae]|uniref:Uncharacterized protein n=1 Tax=Micromonospora coriariae TaxID=285665 RepID=A0A1C4YAS9_9ACTN|nr:hypothetical protein [Micromonospora coriariae]SCF17853.1 hypothetical protein GA0070607_6512 [Micromonospora coriariae]